MKLREREELITRFFAYGDGLEGYKDRPSDFLFAYAKEMNGWFQEHPEEVEQYRKRFKDVMEFCKRVFPRGFRKTQKDTRTPRTRFEALAIGTELALAARPDLIGNTPDTSEWLASDEFLRLTKSGGANPITALKGRLYFVRDKLVGA